MNRWQSLVQIVTLFLYAADVNSQLNEDFPNHLDWFDANEIGSKVALIELEVVSCLKITKNKNLKKSK